MSALTALARQHLLAAAALLSAADRPDPSHAGVVAGAEALAFRLMPALGADPDAELTDPARHADEGQFWGRR